MANLDELIEAIKNSEGEERRALIFALRRIMEEIEMDEEGVAS